jgi:integrase
MTGTITKYQLKNGRLSWGFVFTVGRDKDGKRIQVVRKGFEKKSEAADALREAISEHENGHGVLRDARTFGVFFKDWLERQGAANWAKMTAEQNGKRAAYALKLFGDVPLQKLTPMALEQHFGTLLLSGGRRTAKYPDGAPLSPKTVREIAALVSQALDKARKWKLIPSNPMDDVDRPTAHKKEVQIPQADEYERFLDQVQGTRYYAFCVLAAASGCRRGELLALQWPDIDAKTGVISVSKSASETKAGLEIKSTKSRKTRYVRVSRTTLQVLLEHKKQIEQEKSLFGSDYKSNDLVFPTPDGSYYSPDRVTGRISEFMQKAGIDASLHSLRHLHASMMLSKHVPIPIVSKRLGHANSQVTLDIYAHAMKNDEATAAELWDEATSEIIGRTQKPRQKESPAKPAVIFGYPKSAKNVVNE